MFKSDRVNLSPNQRRPLVFYGWWIVAACFLNALLTGGFVVLGFTAFFEPIVSDFGWSYAQVSLAASLRGVEVGLFAPILGLFVDRWGPRWLMFGGIVLIGFGLVFLSSVTSLGMFYVGFILIAIGISGCSPTVLWTTIANWFRKKVGIATGIVGSGFAFGGLLVPLVVKLIDVFEWRTAILILGIGMWVIGLPVALILRHKPEQYGYLPDGQRDTVADTNRAFTVEEPHEADVTTKQALKSHTFWHIGLAMMLLSLAISTVIVHIMPYLSSVDISRSTASLVAMSIPLVSIIGRLVSGWLTDKLNKKLVAVAFFSVMVLGLLSMGIVSSARVWMIVPVIILFGVGWGGYSTIRVAMLSAYFGRREFGSIMGFSMGMAAVGSVTGPLFAGLVFDNWTSYQMVWLLLSVLVIAAVVMLATTPPFISEVQQSEKSS